MTTSTNLREELALNEYDESYKGRLFQISQEQFKTLGKRSKWILPAYVAFNWITIFAIVRVYFYLNNPWAYPLFLFLIAGRQGAFLNLAHEMVHRTWEASERLTDFVGKWFCCSAIGMDYKGYHAVHVQHHLYTNQEMDPPSDREKYKVVDLKKLQFWLLFLKDLSGLTALQVFLAYFNKNKEKAQSDFQPRSLKNSPLAKLFSLAVPNLFIFLVIFRGSLWHYAVLWLFPACSIHMFLMRVRGLGEHGLGLQLGVPDLMTKKGQGLLYTRSTLWYKNGIFGLLEKLSIASVGVNYHHEHHLFPSVPFHNLPKLHRLVRDTVVQYNPRVYADSYFKSAFFPPKV